MIRLRRLLESVLSERVSDVVYHATSAPNFLSIFINDTFKLTPLKGIDSIDTEWARSRGILDHYYMSVARSVTSDFVRGGTGENRTERMVFRLDGRKLAARFRGFAHNYGDWVGDEMEDRIVSKKPEIRGFSNYVTGVYFSASTISYEFEHGNGGLMITVLSNIERKGIDIYNCAIVKFMEMVRSNPESTTIKDLEKSGGYPSFNNKCKVDTGEFIEVLKRFL